MTAGITEPQRQALQVLAPLVGADAYLAGGVAVALRIGHRLSRDIDLFVPAGAPEDLLVHLAVQPERIAVVSRAPGTLYAEVNGVPASVIRYAYRLLQPAEVVPDIAVPVAASQDLICMKLSAIAGRGARRDFWDLHALLVAANMPLRQGLSLFTDKYPVEDAGHVIRSLVYFTDADAEPPLEGLAPKHWDHIKSEFTAWVRELR